MKYTDEQIGAAVYIITATHDMTVRQANKFIENSYKNGDYVYFDSFMEYIETISDIKHVFNK